MRLKAFHACLYGGIHISHVTWATVPYLANCSNVRNRTEHDTHRAYSLVWYELHVPPSAVPASTLTEEP